MISNFVVAFAKREKATLGLWLVLLLVGAVVYLGVLPRNGFPSVDVPITVASGSYLVDDQVRVDEDVLKPMAAAAKGVDGVTGIQTFAADNGFTLVADLDTSLTSAIGVDRLSEAFEDIGLPSEADLSVNSVDAALIFNEFDLLAAVQGPDGIDPAELDAAAEPVVAALESHPDIERAEILRLLTTGIDPSSGSEVTRQTNFAELALRDASNIDARPAVSIGVVATGGVDAIAIEAASTGVLEDLELDDGFSAVVSFDQATQISQQISSLQRNVFTGILAVAVVSLLLIGWRAALITSLFVFTVMAVAMIVLWLVGISLNTISLFGLILTLGLFVDDAIVIVEAIDAFRKESDSPIETIRYAISRVGSASVSGTLTTVLVFAPMLFVSGVLGDFIRQLPTTVIIGLILSLLLSLIIIPTLSRTLLLGRDPKPGLLAPIETRLARGVSWLPAQLRDNRRLGIPIAIGGIALSVGLIFAGLQIAGQVGFDIFPAQDDGNEIAVEYEFQPGLSIEQAQAVASQVNETIINDLGDLLERSFTYFGNERSAGAQLTLVDFAKRDVSSPELADRLELLLNDVDQARITVSILSNGPPESEFPFSVQIFGEDVDKSIALGNDIAEAVLAEEFVRRDNSTFTVAETRLDRVDVIAREDGRRSIEFLARYTDDDTTTLLDVTESFVKENFGPDELEARGHPRDALGFDFGQETENEESFASTISAFVTALVLMFVLLAVQFRSLLQPLLVFLAIPFSFFGVFGGLWLTGNPISFFVMLGLIGLIGIAVNNTILLTDFANQERKAGADKVTAIETALRRRFRPLVATSLTTVAGLLPLALSDPFWEALAFTIIFGLLSSTLLVLLSFPYYYLGVEWLRDKVRQLRRRGRADSIDPASA